MTAYSASTELHQRYEAPPALLSGPGDGVKLTDYYLQYFLFSGFSAARADSAGVQ